VDVQELYRNTATRNASGAELVDDPIVEFAWSLSEAMFPDRPSKPTPTKEIARDLESKNKARRKAAETKMQTALAKWESEEAVWNAKSSPMRDAVIQRLHAAVPMELRTLPTDAPMSDADVARLPKSVIVLDSMDRPQIHRIRAAKSLTGREADEYDSTYPLLASANLLSRKEGVIGLSGFERIAGNPVDGPLNSAEGYTTFVSAMNGAVISITPDGYKPGDAGKTVRLSIDIAIQEMVEKRVNETVKFSNAQGGRSVVVNTETGEILAAYSVLNPNTGRPPIATDFALKQKGMDESQKAALARMRWATDPFEPGSIFKPFVWAWALDNGIARRDQMLALPAHGFVFPGGKKPRVIKEAHGSSYGPKTWEQVLVKSVNNGMVWAAQQLGAEAMRTCLDRWGFGQSTHTFGQMAHPELDCESSGIMPPAREWNSKSGALVSTSFGQGIGVTPLQVIHAFTAFCREGDMVPLTLQPIASDSLTGSTRVLSSNAAHETREVMEKVITEGTGKRLKDILEYRAFGKSGTAQLTSPTGGYLQGHHMSSFMVGAPFDKPQIAVLVTIEDPDETKLGEAAFGGALAGPCSARIVNDVLGYLGAPPDNGGELVYDGEREKPQPGTKVAAKTAAKKSQPAAKPQPKPKLASAAR